jgi:hypothetical protein
VAYSDNDCNVSQITAPRAIPSCLETPDKSGVVRARSDKSAADYRTRCESKMRTLSHQLERTADIVDVIEDLRLRAPLLRKNSYYLYRASILQVLRDMFLAGEISTADAEALVLRMKPKEGEPGIASRVTKRRTSAGRQKSVRESTISVLVTVAAAKMTPTGDNLADLLEFGPRLGLRPREFFGAKLEGSVLKVRSAKFSAINERGLAEFRPITLSREHFDDFDLDALRRLLARLEHEFDHAGGDIDRLVRRYAAGLRRLRVDVPSAKSLTLTTMRHQFRATTRRAGYSRQETAALMSHRSGDTGALYGAANRGWRAQPGQRPVEPSPDQVAKVQPGARTKAKLARGEPTTVTEARRMARDYKLR